MTPGVRTRLSAQYLRSGPDQISVHGPTRTPLNPLNPNLPMTPAMAGYGLSAGIKIGRQPGQTENIPQTGPRDQASNMPIR
jgi:hypothetical protein